MTKTIMKRLPDVYKWECPECGAILESEIDDLKIIDPWRPSNIAVTCPECKKTSVIKPRKFVKVKRLKSMKNVRKGFWS